MHPNWVENLFLEHSRKFYLVALGITGQRELAADAVHDAMVSLVRSRSTPDDPTAYAYRSVRNRAIRLSTGRDRFVVSIEEFLVDDAESEAPQPEEAAFLHEVCQGLEDLSPDQRETLVLHLFGGMTFREIAEIREISLNTITSWYRRGIGALRRGLVHDGKF
ncbi:MAG: sigma-70 family RNA polymerase sigma factor [Wenzhouxiangella sp.]|jgi:RNA polymerase sigma-70 factor (ECF subfamily)|nr:sigma-70 family RNA polymerase sigma factor [Wenzhouxiangella sp.]